MNTQQAVSYQPRNLADALRILLDQYDNLLESNGASVHLDAQGQVTAGDWVGGRLDIAIDAIRKFTS